MHGRGARGVAAPLVAATVAAFFVIAASFASAAGPVKSSVKILEAGVSDSSYLSIGVVTSPRKECLGDRKVKFIVKRPGGTELLDVARTSDRGGWTSVVPESDYTDGGVNGTTYKLAPRTVRQGGSKIKCGGSKVSPS